LRALLEQRVGIQSLVPGQSLEASYLEQRRAERQRVPQH
jgi:hypothetical protein